MNLHLFLVIFIRHCRMVRVSFDIALTRQSENTRQNVHGHIEACHVTMELSPNLFEISRANFDSHHFQHVKEFPQQSEAAEGATSRVRDGEEATL